MSGVDVLITGAPRSGTTLACHLLNKVPDVVALHEPMQVKYLANISDRSLLPAAIAGFCADQRRSLRERQRAVSKSATAPSLTTPSGAETRASTRERSWSDQLMLVIKHNSAFAAVLRWLVPRFPVFAIIRNPLATLGSWGSVEFKVRRGQAPGAERLDPELSRSLQGIDDPIDRQIYLLGWFHAQFDQFIPRERTIRYETVIESGGRSLAIINSQADSLRESLVSRNDNPSYDFEHMRRAGEKLLETDGPHWIYYSRQNVEELLQAISAQG